MSDYMLNKKYLDEFSAHLVWEERASATREKYLRDIRSFYHWLRDRQEADGAQPGAVTLPFFCAAEARIS